MFYCSDPRRYIQLIVQILCTYCYCILNFEVMILSRNCNVECIVTVTYCWEKQGLFKVLHITAHVQVLQRLTAKSSLYDSIQCSLAMSNPILCTYSLQITETINIPEVATNIQYTILKPATQCPYTYIKTIHEFEQKNIWTIANVQSYTAILIADLSLIIKGTILRNIDRELKYNIYTVYIVYRDKVLQQSTFYNVQMYPVSVHG